MTSSFKHRALIGRASSEPTSARSGGLDLDHRPPRPSISLRVAAPWRDRLSRAFLQRTEPPLMNIGRHLHHGPRACRLGGAWWSILTARSEADAPPTQPAEIWPVRSASVGRRRVNRHSRRPHVG